MVYKRPLVLFFVKSYLEALFEAQLDCYHRLQNVFASFTKEEPSFP